MANQTRSPGRELRAGRRDLEELDGVELLRDWEWSPAAERWFLTLRLTIQNPQGRASLYLPAQTNWCVVAKDYPRRAPEFYPAKEGGITATFPHQSYNGEGHTDVPWRSGNLCLHRPLSVLGRVVGDDEPYSADERLLWRCQRALAWLSAADRDELVLNGEPWELPDVRGLEAGGCSFAFAENQGSYALWQNAPWSGRVDLGLWKTRPDRFFAYSFQSALGEEIYKPNWGAQFRSIVEKVGIAHGVWFRLKSVPLVKPYGAPLNWRELEECVAAQELDLDELLFTGYPELRDGRKHLALIGYPIPRKVGEVPSRMHWQAVQLPVLTRKTKGFRPIPKSASLYDRAHTLRGKQSMDWVESANWDCEQLAGRGRLGAALSEHDVLLVGAGALGSAMAELLVRAGVQRLTIVDGDIFQVGNLVRHTLILDDLDIYKAPALAARLNGCSPQADVRWITGQIPDVSEQGLDLMREATLILDCTGDDELLKVMGEFSWQSEKLFVSCSLGWRGQRLWVFSSFGESFDSLKYFQELALWLQLEREEYGAEMAPETAPREGIGCWSPVFPARLDDIWIMAALAVKHLDDLALTPSLMPQLAVWEQSTAGVCRVELPTPISIPSTEL